LSFARDIERAVLYRHLVIGTVVGVAAAAVWGVSAKSRHAELIKHKKVRFRVLKCVLRRQYPWGWERRWPDTHAEFSPATACAQCVGHAFAGSFPFTPHVQQLAIQDAFEEKEFQKMVDEYLAQQLAEESE
jgi:hypothetical protein